jgi:catechol 2,3-dioxygenase-like lactoylglutathione lyase family enzyme
VTVRFVRPILNVSDVRGSLAWFESLGWETRFVWDEGQAQPGFGGTGCGDNEIFLCRDGQGSRETRRPAFPFDESTGGSWMSWFLETPQEVDEMHSRAVDLGLDVSMPPTDEPWGVREFHLRHPDGHTFRVGAYVVGKHP